jgi:3-dehydroquinate synthase class II
MLEVERYWPEVCEVEQNGEVFQFGCGGVCKQVIIVRMMIKKKPLCATEAEEKGKAMKILLLK